MGALLSTLMSFFFSGKEYKVVMVSLIMCCFLDR